jgi:hypothetical protein
LRKAKLAVTRDLKEKKKKKKMLSCVRELSKEKKEHTEDKARYKIVTLTCTDAMVVP